MAPGGGATQQLWDKATSPLKINYAGLFDLFFTLNLVKLDML